MNRGTISDAGGKSDRRAALRRHSATRLLLLCAAAPRCGCGRWCCTLGLRIDASVACFRCRASRLQIAPQCVRCIGWNGMGAGCWVLRTRGLARNTVWSRRERCSRPRALALPRALELPRASEPPREAALRRRGVRRGIQGCARRCESAVFRECAWIGRVGCGRRSVRDGAQTPVVLEREACCVLQEPSNSLSRSLQRRDVFLAGGAERAAIDGVTAHEQRQAKVASACERQAAVPTRARVDTRTHGPCYRQRGRSSDAASIADVASSAGCECWAERRASRASELGPPFSGCVGDPSLGVRSRDLQMLTCRWW